MSLKFAPPVAKKIKETVYFGENPTLAGQFRGLAAMNPPKERTDEYFWLRDETRKDEAVISHLKVIFRAFRNLQN